MLSLGRKPLDFSFFPGQNVAEARAGDSPFTPCRGLREAPWLTVYRVIGVSMKAELSLARRTRKRVIDLSGSSALSHCWKDTQAFFPSPCLS